MINLDKKHIHRLRNKEKMVNNKKPIAVKMEVNLV
jgi:hypothetical protein